MAAPPSSPADLPGEAPAPTPSRRLQQKKPALRKGAGRRAISLLVSVILAALKTRISHFPLMRIEKESRPS